MNNNLLVSRNHNKLLSNTCELIFVISILAGSDERFECEMSVEPRYDFFGQSKHFRYR